MVRAHHPHPWLLVLAAAALCPGARADGQPSWKLYDVRDVLAKVASPGPLEVATPERALREPAFGMVPIGIPSETQPADPGDELISRLCDGLGGRHMRLLPGLYGIEADETDHARILEMLEAIRSLYDERYDVELILYTLAGDHAPGIGEHAQPVAPLHRHHLVLARRTPTQLTRVSLHTYVAALSPVVAQDAAAYDLETRTAPEGLQLTILVGAGAEDGNATPLQISGELRRITMGRVSAPVTYQGYGLHVELPRVDVRSIQSTTRVEFETPTVVSVVDGFDDGQCQVLGATVRKLPN